MQNPFKIVDFTDLSQQLGTYLSLPFIIRDNGGTGLVEALYRCLQSVQLSNIDNEDQIDTQPMKTLVAVKKRFDSNILQILANRPIRRELIKTEIYLSPPLNTSAGVVQFLTQQITVPLADGRIIYSQSPLRFTLSEEGDDWLEAYELEEIPYEEIEQHASACDGQENDYISRVLEAFPTNCSV